MRRRFVPLVLVALLAVIAGASLRAGAQEATPAATAAGTPTGPVTPAPEECVVAPRTLVSFQGLATPAADPATPAPITGADGLPAGAPADPATIAGITAATRELIACINAGEVLRGLALYSDPFLRSQYGQGAVSEESFDAAATPRPRGPETWVSIARIRDARVLADGRVGAIVTVVEPTSPRGEDSSLLLFVRVGDRWLLDGAIDQLPGEATPAP